MSAFFLDIWQDLRAKRLWPVAVALALALVAVPALLLDGSGGEEVAGPVPQPAPAGDTTPVASPAPEPLGGGTRLDAFDSKNPFDSPLGASSGAGGQGSSDDPAGGGGDSAIDNGGGSTTGFDNPGSSSASTGGGGGGGGGVDNGGGSTTGFDNPPSDGDNARVYSIDVLFGREGSERKREGIQPLDLIPNADRPLLMFVGVTASGKSAVFLVDSELDTSGEGSCVRGLSGRCTYLYLRADADYDDRTFEDNAGRRYHLRLLAIDSN